MYVIKKRLLPVLEHALFLVIILECNSLYTNGVNDFSFNMTIWLTRLAVVLAILTAAIHLAVQPHLLRKLAGNLSAYAGLLLPCIIFFFAGVRPTHNSYHTAQYVRGFLLFMPILTVLFQVKRWEGQPFELFFRHSDIVCALGIANMTLYLVSVLRPDQIMPYTIRTTWNDMGRLQEWSNFLNLLVLRPGVRWQLLGAALPRNYGVFTEPLMYSIQIITALFTELFLRDKKDPYRMWRCALYSIIMLSAQTTLGMILTGGAWGLKVIEVGSRKNKRKAFSAGLTLMALLCLFFVLNKRAMKFEATEVTGSSFESHYEDYKYGLKAFLNRPLVGGGFQNEDYLRSFFTEKRLKHNRGFSNSVAVVLGEGGILLGLICMLPYLFFLLQIRSDKWKKIALWGMGPLGLYCLTIFHFRLYLLTVMAFGYSMLDIRYGMKRCFQAIWDEESVAKIGVSDEMMDAGQPENEATSAWKWLTGRAWRIPLILLAGMAAVLLCGKPVWDALYLFMAAGRFTISQSPVRTFWLGAIVMCHIIFAGWVLQGQIRFRYLAAVGFADAVYLWLYPIVASAAETLLILKGMRTELRTSSLLLVIYAALVVCAYLNARLLSLPRGKKIVGIVPIAFICMSGFGIWSYIGREMDNRTDEILERADALTRVTDAASGRVYSNALPFLYHRVNPKLSITAATKTGLCLFENITVFFDRREDLGDWFNAGFQMTELTEGCVIYTNDPEVIRVLQEDGFTFYRYYPFTRNINLKRQAEINGVEPFEGGILLTDEDHSMLAGPNDTLYKDSYTLSYSLHAAPSALEMLEEDTPVCRLSVSRYAGEDVLNIKEVTAGQFSENGDVLVEVPFQLSTVSDKVEYRAAAVGAADVLLQSLSIRHTPDYITVVSRNAHQMPVREEYYTLDGLPYQMASGYAGIERTYNLADQMTAVKYLNDELAPVAIKNGYAEIRYKYNSRSAVSRESYFGPDGEAAVLRTGEAAVEKDYDAYGNVTVLRYYGTDGKETIRSDGYAEIHRTYNGKKQLIKEEYYDTKGERITLPAGYTAFTREYDEEGNIRLQTWLDETDLPIRITSGYARIRYTYNEKKQVIREEYLGTEGERVLCSGGYAILEKKYDDAGNVILERYFATNEQPSPCSSGYEQLKREYNEKKQAVRELYYDAQGTPVSAANGCFGTAQQYDDRGNVSVRTFLDAEGEPCMQQSGFSAVRYMYDERSNVLSESYFDADGHPVTASSGCAEIRRVYNEKNQCTEESYYDLEERRCGRKDGVFARERFFDEAGRIIRQVFIGEDGYPAPNVSGVTETHYTYDNFNCKIAESYFNENRDPVVNAHGVHEIRYEYTARRQNAAELYFGLNGEPAGGVAGESGLLRTYDAAGNVETMTWINSERLPVRNGSGYASWRREYDLYRNIAAEYYYDEFGNPAENSSGVAEVHRVFGKNRELREQHMLDLDGNEITQ